MKKLPYLMLFLVSCSKQKINEESLVPHLYSQEKVLTMLSIPVQHFGINRLEQVYNLGNEVSYSYSGKISGAFFYKQVETNKIQLKLANMTLVLDKKTAIYLEKGIDIFKHPVLTEQEQMNFALCFYLYNELASPEITRTTAVSDPKSTAARPYNPQPCQDMMISYLYYTRSGAEENVNAAVDRFLALNSPYCSRKYGVDAACLWEDYGCIATQSIECCSAPL